MSHPTELPQDPAHAKPQAIAGRRLYSSIAFAVYFALVFLCFFNKDLFFYLDEYAGLERLAGTRNLLRFVLHPHNEHFIPLGQLFWAIEVFCFREHYYLYVLVNVALLAALAVAWERWLIELGTRRTVAFAIPLVAVTCLAQADNIMVGWQAQLLLCAIAVVGALRAYNRGNLGAAFFFCFVAGFTFSTADALPLCFSAFCLYEYVGARRNRRALRWSLLFVTVFVVLACVTALGWLLFPAPERSGVLHPLWGTGTFIHNVGQLAWLGWYTLSVAFWGPWEHIFVAKLYVHPAVLPTLLSLTFAFSLVFISWKSRQRLLVVTLLIIQAALFVLVSPFRHTPDFVGFAGRYYTAGLVPLLSAVAIAICVFLDRQPRWSIWLLAGMLAIVVVNVCRSFSTDWLLVRCGRASRLNYFETKKWLQRHRGQVVGNNPFSPSVAPWVNVRRLLPTLALLDPSFSAIPSSIRPVTSIEDPRNTRVWGPIVAGRSAVQSFQFEQPQVITNLQLLVNGSLAEGAVARLTLRDSSGHTLWQQTVRANEWGSDTWLSVPVDMVRVEPGGMYLLEVSCTSTDPKHTITIWMDAGPAAYNKGTQAPDGERGSFTFRLSTMNQ